jgi:GT2 family glycosyltransferase
MLVSVIIPNYNGSRFLRDCLDSLSRQSFKNFEVIVIDNASTDNSCYLLEQYYPNIKLYSMDENKGFSEAVNRGIELSCGKLIALLNNDTKVEDNWLRNLVNCIDSNDKIFSCCSKMIRYHEKNKIDDTGDKYTILGWAYKRGDGANINKYIKNSDIFSSCAGAAIYRRDILDKIGGFDDSFFAYMEDVDISYRAKIYGYKNVYCSDAVVYHVGSATSGSRHNAFKVRLAARNNIYLIIKNMPILQLAINAPLIILGGFIKYLFFLRKGLGSEYIKGIIEAIRSIGKIKRVQYTSKHLINYVKIEVEMIVNTFKMIYYAIYNKW